MCLIWKVLRDIFLGVPLVSFVWSSCSRFTAQIPPRYSLLSPGFFVFPLSGGFVEPLLVPLFPVIGHSMKFSDGLPCNYKPCPRKSVPCLLLLLYCDEEFIIVFISLLYNRLTSMDLFPQIMRGKRDWYRLKRINFPDYHVTQWFCTEFAKFCTLRARGTNIGNLKTELEVAVI